MNERERLIELLRGAKNRYINLLEFEKGLIATHLLENGVIVPPCRVGDIVYLLCPVREGIYEAFVDEICVMKESNFIVTRDIYFNRRQSIFFEQIGKTVFLTKEEAEKALKERD